MVKKGQTDPITEGEKDYQEWRQELRKNPEYQAIYEEEAAKGTLWLQLVAARRQAGLTQQQMAERIGVSQAQVSRIEQRGYDAYTLNTLRRYVAALGDGYLLEVTIRTPAQSGRDWRSSQISGPSPHLARKLPCHRAIPSWTSAHHRRRSARLLHPGRERTGQGPSH